MNNNEYKKELIALISTVQNACPVFDDDGLEMDISYKDFVANQVTKAKCCHDIFNKLNGSTIINSDSMSSLICALLHLAKSNKIDTFELIMTAGDEYLSDLLNIGRHEVK